MYIPHDQSMHAVSFKTCMQNMKGIKEMKLSEISEET